MKLQSQVDSRKQGPVCHAMLYTPYYEIIKNHRYQIFLKNQNVECSEVNGLRWRKDMGIEEQD